MQTWQKIATCTKTSNLGGKLVVDVDHSLPSLFFEGMQLCFVPPKLNLDRFLKVETFEQKANSSYVLKLQNLEDIDRASKYVGSCVLALREDVANAEEQNNGVLEFEVVDKKFGRLGTVKEILANKSQDIFLIDTGKGDLMIPYVDAFVLDIDYDLCRITTLCPPDLLSLSD